MNHPLEKIGQYELVKSVGRGGFAEVYLGRHIYLNTQAAIKVLQTHLSKQAIESFLNEAQTIARLQHSHIIEVLDYGIDTAVPFLVMEYAPYGSLHNLHPPGNIVPLPAVVSYVRQIASALYYAHLERVIHRDVKPGNILLGNDNTLKLTDFGISTIAHATASLTTLDYMGTPVYMSPEACEGKPRFASDQYSLAIMVYEWLTGVPPFQGKPLEIMHQHTATPPPSLCEKNPALSPEIEQVVLRALAKDYHQRFPSIHDFANALEQAVFPGQVVVRAQPVQEQHVAAQIEPISISGSGQRYTVFDIGTQMVRAAVIEVYPGRVTVVGNTEVPQSVKAMQASDITDLQPVTGACTAALSNLVRQTGGTVAPRAVVGLSSSLLLGDVCSVTKQRAEPQKRITREESLALIHSGLQRLYEKARAKLSLPNGHEAPIPIQLIDCMPLIVTIDGVRVTNPEGFQGRNFSLSLFGAFIPQTQFQAIATILQELQLTFYNRVEQMTALSRVLLRYTDIPENALVIDVGAGTTKILQLSRGKISGLLVLPYGGRQFTHALTQYEGISWEEAEYLKCQYGEGTITGVQAARYQRCLEKAAQQWRSQVQQALLSLNITHAPPSHMYILGEGARVPEVLASLKVFSWQEYLPFPEMPTIERLAPPNRLCTLGPANMEKEQNLLLLATAYEMYQDTATENTIMNHLIQKVVEQKHF